MTAEHRELSRPGWQFDSPVLLTRAQAAQLCQVSVEILDQWSYEAGFPVIRRNGGHFVRIHRAGLERWLEDFAGRTNLPAPRVDDPPQHRKRTPAGNPTKAGVVSVRRANGRGSGRA